MSTTENREVALEYAGCDGGIVLEVGMTPTARGANLEWCSQYPHERECTFPPLTFLSPTGTRCVGAATVCELQPSVSIGSYWDVLQHATFDTPASEQRLTPEELQADVAATVKSRDLPWARIISGIPSSPSPPIVVHHLPSPPIISHHLPSSPIICTFLSSLLSQLISPLPPPPDLPPDLAGRRRHEREPAQAPPRLLGCAAARHAARPAAAALDALGGAAQADGGAHRRGGGADAPHGDGLARDADLAAGPTATAASPHDHCAAAARRRATRRQQQPGRRRPTARRAHRAGDRLRP